jgi:hypothetical protein
MLSHSPPYLVNHTSLVPLRAAKSLLAKNVTWVKTSVTTSPICRLSLGDTESFLHPELWDLCLLLNVITRVTYKFPPVPLYPLLTIFWSSGNSLKGISQFYIFSEWCIAYWSAFHIGMCLACIDQLVGKPSCMG